MFMKRETEAKIQSDKKSIYMFNGTVVEKTFSLRHFFFSPSSRFNQKLCHKLLPKQGERNEKILSFFVKPQAKYHTPATEKLFVLKKCRVLMLYASWKLSQPKNFGFL